MVVLLVNPVLVALAIGVAAALPPAWQPPFPGAQCSGTPLSPGGPGELSVGWHRCTLPAGTRVGPGSARQPDLRLAPSEVTLFFSPAWNSWSLSGAPIVYGAVGGSSFLYTQRLNASGAYLDGCPIPTWEQTIQPAFPADCSHWTTGAPGVSPCTVANTTSLGWLPPLPAATNFTLLEELTVSDALLLWKHGVVPNGPTERAELFLELYASLLPLVAPERQLPVDDWATLAAKSELDLQSDGAQVVFEGHRLLRSYFNDNRASGELVTQLDVMEPLSRFNASSRLYTSLLQSIKKVSFYHPEIGCIADSPGSSVMTNATVLDGWYVLNPLVKLAEFACRGEPWAAELLLKSVDHVIRLARKLHYVWPVQYNPVTLQPAGVAGEERSDVYGYMYLMLRCYALTSNSTYLTEALAAHDQPGALHRGEFFDLYERPFLEWGALALLELSNITGNPFYAREALQPLAYTIPSIGTYQAQSGYRDAVPTFMQVSAMRSAYSAAFETHHTLLYLHRILQTSTQLPAKFQLPAHVTDTLKTVIKYALGYSRFAYPDKLPAFAMSRIARPAGPAGTKSGTDPFNFTNDFDVAVPVEDYWGSVSHVGSSPWTGDQPYRRLDSLIKLGSIGQEIYGAGLAFEAAMLAPIYGSVTAARPDEIEASWQLTDRVLYLAPGDSVAVPVYPPIKPQDWANASVLVQGAGVSASLQYNDLTGSGEVLISLPSDLFQSTNEQLETVLWLRPGPLGLQARPIRVVVVLVV